MCERARIVPKQHQLEGIGWMVKKECGTEERGTVRGGILADDMGMGKTLQVLGTMVLNPVFTLIVVPTALMDQWAEIFRTYLGHIPLVYHGHTKRTISEDDFMAAPVVITSYGTIVSNAQTKRPNLLFSREWGRVVFDEAHRLRNRSTAVYHGARSIKTDHMWLVTGTIVQNSVGDLRALLQLLGVYVPTHVHLKVAVQRHVLRRERQQQNTPNRTISTRVEVAWTKPNEKRIAQTTHAIVSRMERNVTSTFGSSEADVVVRQALDAKGVGGYAKIVRLIGEFVAQEHADEVVRNSITKEREKMVMIATVAGIDTGAYNYELQHYSAMRKACVVGSARGVSSKMRGVIDDIVSKFGNGHDKLVFTNYRREVSILGTALTERGFRVAAIDGRVSRPKRRRIVAGLTSGNVAGQGKTVLLVHIRSGNEGLNLQMLSEVYFTCPNWNPSMEAQAVARCDRMGQKKQVSVYRFSMEGFGAGATKSVQSMDEYVEGKQRQKERLIREIDMLPNVVAIM
jgi:SNF2 family DNA or RNA helicase